MPASVLPQSHPPGRSVFRFVTRHLRYQIIIPYLLLAIVFAAGGIYLFVHAADETRRAQFDDQLLSAVQAAATSLARAEAQQVEGLRPMLFTEGLLDALSQRDSQRLYQLIDPLARNSGFDQVGVVGSDGALLLDWQATGPGAGASRAEGPTPPPPEMNPLVQAALHPQTFDKTSAVVDAAAGFVFYTAGPIRQRDRVVGAIFVGSALPGLLHQIAEDSRSQSAAIYGAGGLPLDYAWHNPTPGATSWPALPPNWYQEIRARPDDPARFRTVAVGAETYVEVLGPVPGQGLADGPGGPSPGVYGVTLSTRVRDAGVQEGLWLLIPGVGLGLLLIIGIGQVLAAQIDRPVAQLIRAAEEVAQGNLLVQVPVTREDELGVLAEAFNRMNAQLRTTVERLRETAVSINQSTTEISTAATEQAQGSDAQARAIAQAVRTMEALNETATHIAAAAGSVAEAAAQAQISTERGQAAVQDSILGMMAIKQRVNEIVARNLALSEQSQHINEVIGLINQIAAQTHILALNAAVESAGAGEAGQRFAVVAAEVKKLARRSIIAGKEVRTLIAQTQAATATAVMATEEGLKEVERGVLLARQSGEANEMVSALVERTAQLAAGINFATQQQRTASAEVVNTMSEVVLVTHQVATVSRKTLAVVGELGDVAQQLDRVTGQFQLSQPVIPGESPRLQPVALTGGTPYDIAESC